MAQTLISPVALGLGAGLPARAASARSPIASARHQFRGADAARARLTARSGVSSRGRAAGLVCKGASFTTPRLPFLHRASSTVRRDTSSDRMLNDQPSTILTFRAPSPSIVSQPRTRTGAVSSPPR